MTLQTIADGESGLNVRTKLNANFTELATAQNITPPVGSSAITVASTTQTTSRPVLDLAQAWNAAGVTFTGLKFNVTDTASAAGSLLVDWQVGGVSQASISKAGILSLPVGASNAAPSLNFGNTAGIYSRASGSVNIGGIGTWVVEVVSGEGIRLAGQLSFGSVGGGDTVLLRDAANTFAQRNGTAAQEFRVYGTFTDTSNYRRLSKGMSTAGVAFLRPEGAGTGASGNVLHISGLPTSNPGPGILWNNAGTPAIGT